MRRGDAGDVLVVAGWLLLAAAVGLAWGGLALLGYAGASCLVIGLTLAWAGAARR